MNRLSTPARVMTLIAMLFAAGPAWSLPRKEEWIELKTANFTLYSNAGRVNTERIGTNLERLRSALKLLTPDLSLSSPYPTSIFVFKNASSLEPYQRIYNGRPQKAGGYFMSRSYGNYVAINGDPRGDEMANIHHEYLHYVIRNNYPSLPLWLNEGLAEYYSTFEVSGNEAKIGLPHPHHIVWLRKNALIPLPKLLSIDEQSPEYNEESPRGSFYAQSWALVHYLLAGSPDRRLQAVEYLRLIQTGSPREEAFRKTFGDPAALERELRAYIQGYVFNFSRAPVEPGTNLTVEARPMAWHDVLYRLGNLLVNVGAEHEKAAAEHFKAALEAQPDHGPALSGLGEIEERAGRRREAQAFYDRAAKLAPGDFLIQYLYGENLLELDQSRESREKARAALTRVVALQPDFGEAWARIGYSYNGQEALPPEAIQALETAFRLLPSRMDVTHNLAIAYAQNGQRDKALKLIDRMVAAKAEAQYVENAREALLSDTHRRAEVLIGQQKVEEAIPLLEEVRDKTARPDRRAEIERRIADVREVLDFNRFADRYNEAVRLANQGKHKDAVAVLEPLVQTTKNPDQARQAQEMLERIQALLKR
ncbi:MAG TPA: tetratricopeptide repeat protein [Thermoanaerobaculia bacterium]|nr:tetratricopeptide repeat protein [Thermoanaerobaculia bacterium]